MAYVRQYGNGSWQAVVRRKGSPPQSQTFTTRDSALKWARANESRIDACNGTQGLSYQRVTLAEAFDRYMQEVNPHKALRTP